MRKSILFILLIVLSACDSITSTPKPDEFYGDEKMADILTDLYLMESAMTTSRGQFTELQVFPDSLIYSKYDTDSLTFADNLYYYSDRVEEYNLLMDKVLVRLDVLKDSVTVRQQRQLDKDNSLNNPALQNAASQNAEQE